MRRYTEEDRGYATPCWVWSGPLCSDGYGKLPRDRGLAHRVMYELMRESVPRDHEIDHLCRVRSCINPDHLEPVPHKINTWRSANAKLNYEIASRVRDHFSRWPGSKASFKRVWAADLSVSESTIDNIVMARCWVPPQNGMSC